jgi:hypothetical protein
MLRTDYNYYTYARVVDMTDFYNSSLPEILKVKRLIEASKKVFNVPDNRVTLDLAETSRVYKITLLTPDVNKYPFAWLFYLPQENRVDLYNSDSPYRPFIQWKNKKLEFKNFSVFFDRAKIEKVFDKLVSVL